MNECDVFMAALEIESSEERDTYLDEACGKDTSLRRRVEGLLECHARSGSLLEHPAVEGATAQLFGEVDKLALSGSDDGGSVPPLDEISLDFLDPSDAPDSLGRLGPYEITEVVGRGGMGIVLKGNDPKLNRIVAVKVLAPELASNASARKRFLREGRAAAAVSHDHVVTIYGIDDSETLPFIAMEYISGPSLEDRIKGEGPLELNEILRIGMQIASGLAAAHEQGLAHRDIKPANILLENGVEKVKITDFGLARAVDDVRMTKPGVVTGTPEYMSPEQARGESVDHRTDLFSLGCVLYAMCTGRSPFRAENTPAMIRRVCEDTPRPVVEESMEVWRIGAEDGSPERIGELTAALGKVSQLRVHPDGQQVAFHTSQSVRRERYQPRMMQMMQSALSTQRAKESCIVNLKTLADAIQRYKDDRGEEPDWLSDLYPDYLQDKGLLLCPEDGKGETVLRYNADPKTPCSYDYRFNNKPSGVRHLRLPVTVPLDESGMTCKKANGLRRAYFGDSTAIVVCKQHSPDLNLGCDGEIYEADDWIRSRRAQTGLLSQLKKAMQSDPDTWAEQYDKMPNLLWLLDDRTPLTKLLQSYAEAHPGDAGEYARQTLDEFRKISFIARSADDAEESGNGRMDLDNATLSARDSPRDREYKDQFVGLRFVDIQVPQGARIKRAYMEFHLATSALAEPKGLVVHGELVPDAESFTGVSHNISSRRKTTSSVECPELWSDWSFTVSPDLASIIQEVVDQPNWREGNALVLIISGSAKCGVQSFDHSGGRRPMLYVEH